MKKIVLFVLFSLSFVCMNAQYGSLDAILTRLEEKYGINNSLKDENIDDRKFVLVKDFDDHTERYFLVLKGNQATYVEIFDDKKSGQSSTNLFTGDVVRSNKNIVSLRADKLEGEKIAIPITKTFLMTKQKKILYLVDISTKERWIDEAAFGEK